MKNKLNQYFYSIIFLLFGLSLGYYFGKTNRKNSAEKSIDKKEKSHNYITNNEVFKSDTLLTDKVLLHGDTLAYYQLMISYLDDNDFELLPYSLIMSNKYNYEKAYVDVFECFLSIEQLISKKQFEDAIYLSSLDEKNRNFAYSYLKKAINLGDSSALYIYDILGKDTLKYNIFK